MGGTRAHKPVRGSSLRRSGGASAGSSAVFSGGLLLGITLLACGANAQAPVAPSNPTPTPAPAPQQAVPDAASIDLYKEARQLLADGKWAEACPKFDAIFVTQPTPAVLINISDCHAHAGKLATASADLERAHVLNAGTLPVTRRDGLEEEIQSRLKALLPRVPTLQIDVEKPVPGLAVQRDGQPVLPGAVGTPLRLDPGPHEVKAEAGGFTPRTYPVILKEGERQTVRIALSPVQQSTASRYTKSIAAGGVAVALGVVTAGLGAWTVSSHHDIVTKCAEGAQPCKDEATALQGRASATNVVLGLAGAAAVTAGVLFFVERSKAPKAEVAISGTGALVRVMW